jgi:hypothetical protein
LQETFRQKALQGNCVSDALLVKIYERRATLLGLNGQPASAVTIIEHERPATTMNSTERIYQVLARLGKTPTPEANGSGNETEPPPEDGKVN